MTSISTTDAGDARDDAAGRDGGVYVIGAGRVGEAIADRLRQEGTATTFVDLSTEPADVPGREVASIDAEALDRAGLDSASTAIVATPSDSRNLLIAQLVRTRFDVDRVVVLVNEPERVDVLADAGHDALCAATTLADALVDQL